LIKRKLGFSGKIFWSLEIPFKTGFTVLYTIEQQTILASKTLQPLSTLVMHHYKAENLFSCIVLVSTKFAFSLCALVVKTF
jgi:hypothetical protein